MVVVCENCKKEGANRLGLDPDELEYGLDVMVSLEIAATDGHPQCLQAIITAGADVNYLNKENGYTPVMWTARYGQSKCLEILIKSGADVNKTECGTSALMFASSYQGNVRCVELLLEAGADVNQKTRRGGTALMDAAGCGHLDVVKQLLKAGADVNAVDEDDVTALIRGAISSVGWKCIQLLVDAGADVNKKCNGKTPLMWTLENGYEKCTEAMIKAGADLNMSEDEHGWTAIGIAAGRDEKCFELLLEAGADVRNFNTLTECLHPWNYERAQKVIAAGADVNAEMQGPDHPLADPGGGPGPPPTPRFGGPSYKILRPSVQFTMNFRGLFYIFSKKFLASLRSESVSHFIFFYSHHFIFHLPMCILLHHIYSRP